MKNMMIIAVLALVGSAAQADTQIPQFRAPAQAQLPAGPRPAAVGSRQAYQAPQGMSVDELRAACSNPNAVGNQIAPSSIRVSCEISRTEMRQVGTTVVAFGNSGSIVAGVGTDKGNTVRQQGQVGVASDQVSCPVMQQFLLSGNPEFAIDCATVNAIPSGATLTDLCNTLISAQFASNPNAAYTNAARAVSEPVTLCTQAPARGH